MEEAGLETSNNYKTFLDNTLKDMVNYFGGAAQCGFEAIKHLTLARLGKRRCC